MTTKSNPFTRTMAQLARKNSGVEYHPQDPNRDLIEEAANIAGLTAVPNPALNPRQIVGTGTPANTAPAPTDPEPVRVFAGGAQFIMDADGRPSQFGGHNRAFLVETAKPTAGWPVGTIADQECPMADALRASGVGPTGVAAWARTLVERLNAAGWALVRITEPAPTDLLPPVPVTGSTAAP